MQAGQGTLLEDDQSLTEDQVRTFVDFVEQLDPPTQCVVEPTLAPEEPTQPDRPREASPSVPPPVDRAVSKGTVDGNIPTEEPQGNEGDSDTEHFLVCQLRSDSLLRVRLKVGDTVLRAVVDTAAQVTLISDRVLQGLEPKPHAIREVTLRNAGRDLVMKGVVVGPVRIQLGQQHFDEDVHVAPIEDDMLLGLDFLRRHRIDVHIKDMELVMENQAIPMEFGITPDQIRVAKVTLQFRVVIPPNTVKRITGVIDQRMQSFVVEPSASLPALLPYSLHSDGAVIHTYAVNPTDRTVRLPQNTQIGEAWEAGVIQTPDPAEYEGFKVLQTAETSEQPPLPEHVADLFERSSGSLSQEQRQDLKRLLIEYSDVFAQNDFDLGNFTAVTHPIDTGTANPIKQGMRRTPLSFVAEEKAHLDRMEQAGVIQPSQSSWALAPVLVRKRDGGVRWCIDYRALNAVTRKDTYPLSNIEECLDTLSGSKWFSKLDANSAYWQVRIQDQDRQKTAFITKYGLYEFVRIGFGLCNAPATFSRAMDLILRGLTWEIVLAFLDDVIVLGTSFQDHLRNLTHVLERFRGYQLKLKPKKCDLLQRKVEFLGREVGENYISLKPDHVEAVRSWPIPKSTKEVEQFLGLVNYHRSFLKGYAETAVPLYRITGKKPFCWGPEQLEAFKKIKDLLTKAPVLTIPNQKDPFILDTDASNDAIGAELLQVQEGEERVIAYGSMALAPVQRRYCVTRRELLAVVLFTRQYRHYLLGRPFTVRTDHSSLRWLLGFKYPQGQLARWLEELSQYDMRIEYRAGRLHANADALSRIPEQCPPCEEYRMGVAPGNLPCGGCSYCQRAHRNWASFVEEVDTVVPLQVRPQSVTADMGEHPPRLLTTALVTEEDRVGMRLTVITEGQEPGIKELSAEPVPPALAGRLKEEQGKDNSLTPLRDWLTSGEEPSEATIMLWGPAQKFVWTNRQAFKLVQGTICMRKDDQDTVLVPQAIQAEIIQLHHDLPSAGHQGRERTKARIKQRYFWYGMSKDIRQYVLQCPDCAANKKPSRYGRAPMINYHAGAPMERVHLDFLGPLPKSAKGNQHILMMVDQFTKWVECVPLPSQTAAETARAAVGEFFSRFGCPFEIMTDQGRNFESKLFVAICKLLKIHKARTTPYRPSANGQVERFNRTLMEALRCFIGKAQTKWDEHLPQLAGALRATVNRSTGFTPNRLMLGREVNCPADLLFPAPKA